MDDILYEAARIVDERGWTQGDFEADDGSVCMAGAVRLAMCGRVFCNNYTHTHGDRDEQYEKIRAMAVKSGLTSNPYPVASINDLFLKTKEEAVKLLMEAAEYGGEE